MTSPWLRIPLADYEAHMALPAVGQAEMLVEELQRAMHPRVPASCAILGCAGGNGFEALARAGVQRIAGIDINSDYVAAARRRHHTMAQLELHVADIQRPIPGCAAVEWVYAGLVFEYVDVDRTLQALRPLCAAGGALTVVLQGPGPLAPVTPSRYASLQRLADTLVLQDAGAFTTRARAAGFVPKQARTRTLASGKRFDILTFAP